MRLAFVMNKRKEEIWLRKSLETRSQEPRSKKQSMEARVKNRTILIAPGILLSGEEYDERFGSLDLELYRKSMTPELFNMFIRHVGCIQGKRITDIRDLISELEVWR